jgi:hypothetical protein
MKLMRKLNYLILLSLLTLVFVPALLSQDDEEPINYFQMEPLDDSLFIHIQEQLYIDPPDPKAEIVVDVRDANNQTISIKGALYPFLALKPETRAQIITYPFKLNLEETINYGSVFTRVIDKMRFDKILNPPTAFQISSTLGYINPFLVAMGGERFGIPIKADIGLSFGFGTPYSGALETNFAEIDFHILGFKAGYYSSVDAFVEIKDYDNQNNIFFTEGYLVSYVIPFGNFFEFGYLASTADFTSTQILKYTTQTVNQKNIVYNPDGTIKYQPYLVDGSYFNWEFRYPVKVLGSTRGRFYAAKFVDELHFGYEGRELALAGSVFDLRLDAMVSSPVRQPEYVFEVLVQRIFDYWAFSTVALGPSIILGTTNSGGFGFTSLFFNLRIKVGASL